VAGPPETPGTHQIPLQVVFSLCEAGASTVRKLANVLGVTPQYLAGLQRVSVNVTHIA